MDCYIRIQHAIDFIEAHLLDTLRVEDIAAKTFFSPFHFQRLFRAISGFSVQGYVRKRRLSEAAILLRESDKTILDIAVLYQYGSHEAFARAFTDCFHITPDRYRKTDAPIMTQSRMNLLDSKIYGGQMKMQINKPQIKDVGPIEIIGVRYAFRDGDDPFDACHGFHRDFGAQEYYARIPGRTHPAISYGISDGESFIVGEEVQDISAPIEDVFVCYEIPAGRYAVFTVVDSVIAVQETIKFIYRTWLPNTNYTLRHAPYFEVTDVCACVYPDRMNMTLYIPIE